MDTREVTKEKLNYFLINNIKVHVSKITKEYINGTIKAKESEEIYVIIDDRGISHRVFVSEVFDVREWVPKEEMDGK